MSSNMIGRGKSSEIQNGIFIIMDEDVLQLNNLIFDYTLQASESSADALLRTSFQPGSHHTSR